MLVRWSPLVVKRYVPDQEFRCGRSIENDRSAFNVTVAPIISCGGDDFRSAATTSQAPTMFCDWALCDWAVYAPPRTQQKMARTAMNCVADRDLLSDMV